MSDTATHTQQDQAYFDIFVTALEGGIGYWSTCSEYRWRRPDADAEATVREAQDVLGFEARISHYDEDEDKSPVLTVNRETIVKGVELFTAWARACKHRNYAVQAAMDLDWGRWDDLDIDAEVADMIVQFGLFDSVVYG